MPQAAYGKPRSRVLPLMTTTAIAFFIATIACGQAPKFAPKVVIRHAFPAIKGAPVVTAAEASRSLAEGELVLGVVVNGKSRAYPINMLTGPQREIINDTLGGRAIAATW
jgi:hypothetical protein